MKKIFLPTVKFMAFSLLCLLLIFIFSAIAWIIITPYTFAEFFYVLSQILKRAGAYSSLLVGVVITVFIQIYTKEKDAENEEKIKVSEVGYYTLTFPKDDILSPNAYDGNRIVVEITNESDYEFNPYEEAEYKYHFAAGFQTSKKESANLKNVMVFGDDYFKENKKQILSKYFDFCDKIKYSSPAYCAAVPTAVKSLSEHQMNEKEFWLVLNKTKKEKETIVFWISAITEEGILLLIKVKAYTEVEDDNKLIAQLLQQTTYYKYKNELKPLYR